MTREIGNEYLVFGVDNLGAELTSLRTIDGYEYLWQGSSESWIGRSPVLFPIIGGLPGDRYFLDGREYDMTSHGFAWKKDWNLVETKEDRLVYELDSDDESRRAYPFDFRFRLSYTLDGLSLSVEYSIENTGEGQMPFSVGGHPGFRCPLEDGHHFNDYHLRFDHPEKTVRYLKKGNLLTGKIEPFELPTGILPLNHKVFELGAIILREFDSESIVLERDGGGRAVKVNFSGFPDLGIWSFPERSALFVCIEPWFGVDSTAGSESDLNLRTKSGILTLSSGKSFRIHYTITIIQ